jgi:C_GCAxxG_C_C family probable redox protein
VNENQGKALDFYRSGFNCAQAVFAAYAPLLGLDENSALKVCGGFGGGMGRLGEVCGVLTGAFMLAGLKHGKTRQENGSIHCRELLGCDLNSEAGRAAFKAQDMRRLKCEQYVADAAALVEELLF